MRGNQRGKRKSSKQDAILKIGEDVEENEQALGRQESVKGFAPCTRWLLIPEGMSTDQKLPLSLAQVTVHMTV